MAEEAKTYWDEENRDPETRRFPPAWSVEGEKHPLETDQTPTLKELVDAIVIRDEWIEHKEVPDLRVLIEAVQRHPDAKLAKLDPGTKKPIGVFDSQGNKLENEVVEPTRLVINGGEVLVDKHHRSMIGEIGCRLQLGTYFKEGRSFMSIWFAASVSFWRSQFSDYVTFDSAHFIEDVDFRGVHFKSTAVFAQVQFHGEVNFSEVSFNGHARFDETRFYGDADFNWAHFTKDAWFRGSQIDGLLDLTCITIERRLLFSGPRLEDACFGPKSRLKLYQLIARVGASIELSIEQLELIEDEQALIERWAKTDSVWDWFVQYLACFFWPIAGRLGLDRRGRLVAGEDSDDANELASARDDYNRLRDFFRSQPSTDEQEEICNFKYHDLKRRAKTADPSISWWKKGIPVLWDWLIMRNALGYLIQWQRILITGLSVILIFAMLYCLCGTDSTLRYDGNDTISEVHSFWNSLYYSVVTFTSFGYGDIHPLGWFKGLVAFEVLIGVVLMALFVVSWARKMVR